MATLAQVFNMLHKDAQSGILSSVLPDEVLEWIIPGEKKMALVATSHRIFVFKKGITSGSFFSKQLNSWNLTNISGIELKSGMTTQVVVLDVVGVHPVTGFGRTASGPNSAWEAPNAIVCGNKPDYSGVVANIRNLIANSGQTGHSSATASAPVTHDPISLVRQLAELRDQGILTEAEFQKKKAELLGL